MPAGKDTLPVYIYTGSRTPALQPQVIAIGAMVVVVSLIVVVAAELGRARAERRLKV